jgi:hypothetical protein
VKTIGDLLALVLDKETQGKLTGQAKLKLNWSMIVEKAYSGNWNVSGRNQYNGDSYGEIQERNRINAQRAAGHSRMAYIKNNVLFVETDHQGWIQILQTAQKKIVEIINREYSNLSIRSIAFLLVNDIEPAVLDDKKSYTEAKITKYKKMNKQNEKSYENIKDEKLKSILMRLENRISIDKVK